MVLESVVEEAQSAVVSELVLKSVVEWGEAKLAVMSVVEWEEALIATVSTMK